MTEIILPFPPSVNGMFGNKKNGKGRGRYVMTKYKKWRADASEALFRQGIRPIVGRCIVHIDLDDKRQGDCDNRVKAILDVLVTHGTLSGDSKKYVRRVSIGWEKIDGCRVAIEDAA